MNIPPFFSRFPVSGKKPLVPWSEYSKRLPTVEELKKWEGNKEWGIATGPVSRIIVLDDDGGLDVKKYPIPRTWTVRTPRGGTHYYFQYVEKLAEKVTTRTEILPKVDIRGSGGFAVFYGWERPYQATPLAYPPQWLIDLLPNKDGIRNSQIANNNLETENKSHLQELLDAISVGNRNESFFRVASSLRARGYSIPDIRSLLVPKAREVGFDLGELDLTLEKSVSKYDPGVRPDESQTQTIDDFLKDQETVEWICEGLIAKKSIGFVVGLPETGKTWAMIDLAVQCAKGDGLWLGKFPVKKQKVLFIDQERFKGETQRRFRCVLGALTGSASPDLSQNLFIKSGTTTRLNLQHSFDAFRKELSEIKPDLVIIDSFVSFHTSEENNRKDIQAVLERVKELRNEFGCTFLFIHHENKMAFDKEQGEPSIAQMAGSIAIPAVAETVFTVRKTADGSMFYQTKSTLASTHEPFLLKVEDVTPDKSQIRVTAY